MHPAEQEMTKDTNLQAARLWISTQRLLLMTGSALVVGTSLLAIATAVIGHQLVENVEPDRRKKAAGSRVHFAGIKNFTTNLFSAVLKARLICRKLRST